MRQKFYATLALLTIVFSNSALPQTFQWANQPIAGFDFAQSFVVTVDDCGNIYTCGTFTGFGDFDPGPRNYDIASIGGQDAYISKLDAEGNFIWARAFGGTSHDVCKSMTLNAVGNAYVTGLFQDSADLDPGPGTFIVTGSYGIFVSKFDTEGNFVWGRNLGNGINGIGESVAIGLSGNVYVTGTDYPGNFIQKFDPAGNTIWVKQFGNSVSNYALALDSFENVYITGDYYGTADFDPGPAIFNLTSSIAGDVFISKLDSSGSFVWAKSLGGNNAHAITVDDSGNVYTIGDFFYGGDFDPGPDVFLLGAMARDIFISKLNTAGNFVWAKRIGHISGAVSSYNSGFSIAVDDSGNVYTAGVFQDTVDFDPGSGTFNLISLVDPSTGGFDGFISKLNASGNFIWAKHIEGTQGEECRSIALDHSNNIYVTGFFSGSTDFDPDTGNYYLTPVGFYDAFLIKFGNNSLQEYEIAGVIITESGNPISSVEVNLLGLCSQTYTTLNDGIYSFTTPGEGSYYTIPHKGNDSLTSTCVTTIDLAMMQRIALAYNFPFSPYQIIAADVNVSGGVTAIDIDLARRVVLNIDSSFPDGRFWMFVPEDFVFADTVHPFPFDTSKTYLNLLNDTLNQNFIGIKLGDLNGSWDQLHPRRGGMGEVKFNMDESNVLPNDSITVQVKVKDFNDIAGYQFTISWDINVLDFLEVNNVLVPGYYGMTHTGDGFLTTSWNDSAGGAQSLIDESVAFEIRFKVVGAVGSYSSIQIGSELTISEAFNGQLELLSINATNGLVNVGTAVEIQNFEFKILNLKIQPNPFNNSTNIIFTIPKDETVSIVIYDLLGKEVKRFEYDYLAGEHRVEWNGDDEKGKYLSEGLYHVRMVAGNYSEGKKVVLIR